MEGMGLPLAFGKSNAALPTKPEASGGSGPSNSQGNDGTRGARGIVGGGRRGRGRGAGPIHPEGISKGTSRGGWGGENWGRPGFVPGGGRGSGGGGARDFTQSDTGWGARNEFLSGIPTYMYGNEINEGFKRPYPTLTDLSLAQGFTVPPSQNSTIAGYNQRPPGSFIRGTGGRGRGGGRGGGHGESERGFFKESYCEDPWKSLMEQRSKRISAAAGNRIV